MPNAESPLWPILTLVVLMACAALLLWANYNHFDAERDIKTVFELGVVYFAWHYLKRKAQATAEK